MREGYIKQIEAPIHYSNVALIDPETGKPCRIRYGFLEDGTRVRLSRKTGNIIEKPQMPTYKDRMKGKVDGVKDTSAKDMLEVTYRGEDFAQVK